jgi:hypothetical protein
MINIKTVSPNQQGHAWALPLFIAAIFAGGLIAGFFFFHGDSPRMKKLGMNVNDCNRIASQISNIADRRPENYGYTQDGQTAYSNDVAKLKELARIYEINCKDTEIEIKKPATKTIHPEPEPEKLPDETCAAIEILLLRGLADENNDYPGNHLANAKIYANLAERGCEQNRKNFEKLALREIEIMRALRNDDMEDYEKTQIVEIYTKAEMKAEAIKFLDKMKRLTEPAVDFIFEAQRVFAE